MADYRIFVCHNVADKLTFKVESVDDIPHLYCDDFYHYKLRLKFNPQENGVEEEAAIIEECYQEIIKAISADNLWEKKTGFYIMDFKTMRLKNNEDDVNNSSFMSLESDFDLELNDYEAEIIDVNFDMDDEDFLSDLSGYESQLSSSSFISNEEDPDLDFSTLYSDDEDFENDLDDLLAEDNDVNFDEDDFLSDESGYGSDLSSSSFMTNEEEFSSVFSDVEDF